MNNSIKIALVFLTYFAIHYVCKELYKRLDLKGDTTRKLVHAATGVLTLSFPFIFDDHLPVALICGIFLIVAWVSREFGWLNYINDILHQSYGSIFQPIIAYLLFLGYDFVTTVCCDTNQYILYFIPMLITSFADPSAAAVGRRYPIMGLSLIHKLKSLGGFLAFTCVATLICIVCFSIFIEDMNFSQKFGAGIVIGLVSAFGELVSEKGWDNVIVPSVSFAILVMVMY